MGVPRGRGAQYRAIAYRCGRAVRYFMSCVQCLAGRRTKPPFPVRRKANAVPGSIIVPTTAEKAIPIGSRLLA